MGFESLSEEFSISIDQFPQEWMPLTYLYDPDLPLFPIQYVHFLDPQIQDGQRPGERDRLFGFIRQINYEAGKISVHVAVNKDLNQEVNFKYKDKLKETVLSRIGLENPVSITDIQNKLTGDLAKANKLVTELWYQVVSGSFGDSLPYGGIWDPVFGLVRFVASWNSQGGRKGELIQTHDFVRNFGEKIQTGGGIHADFYLLPTFQELTDLSNPLSYYKDFATITNAASAFTSKYCGTKNIGGQVFSSFKRKIIRPQGGNFDTEDHLKVIQGLNQSYRGALLDSYSAFNRGPIRPIIFLMMLDDLRNNRWHPQSFTATLNGQIYMDLQGTTQSPKVINLYAQQCFGNETVLPIDEWIETFSKWPLNFTPSFKKYLKKEIFSTCNMWGKIERLIWIASQARKVHASVAQDILWCMRFGSPKEGNKTWLRGANPLSCKICAQHIRNVCPAYDHIENKKVVFNKLKFNPQKHGADFNILTSSKNNTTKGQTIKSCEGESIKDIYSTKDMPANFNTFPTAPHSGSIMSVKDFISGY